MIYLYSDIISRSGGIETYLHALALHLHEHTDLDFRVAVAEQTRCALLDELEEAGIDVYRQFRIPGDSWLVRQRVLLWWLGRQLRPGDWVYCVRQPMPQLYLRTVRTVHRQDARIAASWMYAPRFLEPPEEHAASFRRAVEETDVVVSVSECTVDQFEEVYGYDGPVEVVRYHNRLHFDSPLPLPDGPPWRIGFLGRIDVEQKNIDVLLKALRRVVDCEPRVELHLYGRGPEEDVDALKSLRDSLGLGDHVTFHGAYDHRTDLHDILAANHFFVYTSRFEGGPCFTLLELLQAGRYCVAAPVGGIPDIYDGHPEAGRLVDAEAPASIADALVETVDRVRGGDVDVDRIRERYFDGLDMQAAHEDWLQALQLPVAAAS
ncbi:glycosyltransferase involved in cell wall biosynthesis [Salinibacter ruber]|uniref:glycosyltransferase family 4 protein n=1 Tax=Salinibacter ruber TaxID=146919 RepID=UPI002168456B|nr:glycosyltransferase family 4 protein [Salinibacter ruber]MCS4044601.1 glycosyltransferase involved in cell wall biosynthesis [Salinibacter ruber]